MTLNTSGESQLECFVRSIASPMARPKKKRTRHDGPSLDFFQSGLQKLAERCVSELCTQEGGPRVQDAVRVLGEAANVFAGLAVREGR